MTAKRRTKSSFKEPHNTPTSQQARVARSPKDSDPATRNACLAGAAPEDSIGVCADAVSTIRLLGNIAGMSGPIIHRYRTLMDALAQLIDADTWVHGSWDSKDKAPIFGTLAGRVRLESRRSGLVAPVTTLEDKCTTENTPGRGSSEEQWMRLEGMQACIVSIYARRRNRVSGIAFHRRVGRPSFTSRERSLVHLISSHSAWLHQAGIDASTGKGRHSNLSPRIRQVLARLLQGDSRKQIARRLGLSPHTVADYMKAIHRQFQVNSRGELLSLFISRRRP